MVLTKPLEFYSKNVINFFKKMSIIVTLDIEGAFIENYRLMNDFTQALSASTEIDEANKKLFFEIVCGRRREDFQRLVKEYKYEPVALCSYACNYLHPFENLQLDESLNLLKDYYSMANLIGRDVKKYPKYLKSMHDIITSNFNAYKQKYDEKLFSQLRKSELEFMGNKYCIIVPKCSKDVVGEGTTLNHCVGSYISKILEGKTYIFFLRHSKTPDKSLVTLEYINGSITQAKGSYNRVPTKEEAKFLKEYASKKKLKLEAKLNE